MKTPHFAPLFLGLALSLQSLPAQVPQLINYQGRVQVGTTNFDGSGQFKFALVSSNGSNTFWSNDGTSASGSEPTNPVTLPVVKGLYSVLLGDTTIAQMTGIPSVVFTNPDVRLRVWFSDGVNGSQLLTPDQRLAPTAYIANGAVTTSAIAPSAVTGANIAAGTINGTNVASGSLDFSRLAVASPPAAGQVLSFNGTTLNWTVPGSGGGVWALNGASAYYNGGNVGIGTNAPANKLTILTPTVGYGLEHTDGNIRLTTLVGRSTGYLGTLGSHNLTFFTNNNGFPNMTATLSPNGSFGIGTDTPTSKLDLVGAQDALGITGFQPFLTFKDSNSANKRSRIQSVNGDLNLLSESYLNGSNLFSFLKLGNNGNVGIGSSSPIGKLEVVAQDALRLIGYQPFLTLYDSNASYAGSRIQAAAGDLNLFTQSYLNGSNTSSFLKVADNGNVGIGTVSPVAKLDVNGTTRTKVLTITGGADLAEPFQVGDDQIEKGSVVVIDENHPGSLKRSHTAYDKRVAGIVSGANGIHPGIALQQEGVIGSGQDVALTGRVYVLADATSGPIQAGDLLTSSATPGHAMRARDPHRSQGAVLGKAMTALPAGKGYVLVLVTLQ